MAVCMCVWTISFILLSVDTQPPGLVGDKTIPCRESLNRSSRSRLFYNFYSKERSSSTTTTLVRQVMKRRRITASQPDTTTRTNAHNHTQSFQRSTTLCIFLQGRCFCILNKRSSRLRGILFPFPFVYILLYHHQHTTKSHCWQENDAVSRVAQRYDSHWQEIIACNLSIDIHYYYYYYYIQEQLHVIGCCDYIDKR